MVFVLGPVAGSGYATDQSETSGERIWGSMRNSFKIVALAGSVIISLLGQSAQAVELYKKNDWLVELTKSKSGDEACMITLTHKNEYGIIASTSQKKSSVIFVNMSEDYDLGLRDLTIETGGQTFSAPAVSSQKMIAVKLDGFSEEVFDLVKSLADDGVIRVGFSGDRIIELNVKENPLAKLRWMMCRAELRDRIEGGDTNPNGTTKRPETNGHDLSAAIDRRDATSLIALVRNSDFAVPNDAHLTKQMIEIILQHVRPIPAAHAEENWHGYDALSRLDPANATYSRKAASYRDAFINARYAILNKLETEYDEFSEITWYEHPNTPRYTDTRHYIEVYMGEKAGKVWLRLRLNYTNDSWLFIKSAEAKIDGERVRLPIGDWKRDNDSEIWEWSDELLTPELREIALRIAKSKETIIRLNGSQYYDNMTVREDDKRAIREMFGIPPVGTA